MIVHSLILSIIIYLSAREGSVREKRQALGSPGGYCCYDIRGPVWSTGGTGDRGYWESDSGTESSLS